MDAFTIATKVFFYKITIGYSQYRQVPSYPVLQLCWGEEGLVLCIGEVCTEVGPFLITDLIIGATLDRNVYLIDISVI